MNEPRLLSFSARDVFLHVLGTASQVPTAHRNHNGYLFRWKDEGFLFDPGEGAQRQLVLLNLSASKITRVFLSHFHGDHCLGLPGLVQRLGLQDYQGTLEIHYPASGRAYLDALLSCSAYVPRVRIARRPIDGPKTVVETPDFTVSAVPLEHAIDTLGYVFQEKEKRRLDRAKLEAVGLLDSPLNRDLLRDGAVTVGGRRVSLDDVSELERGFKFGFLMDTRLCAGAEEVARGADLLLAETTYLEAERALARENFHLCTTETATLARDAGVKRLLITHFSQRYEDTGAFERECKAIFPETIAAEDLLTLRL
jgi:ribonuclease Z